jgi:hypothetical protein
LTIIETDDLMLIRRIDGFMVTRYQKHLVRNIPCIISIFFLVILIACDNGNSSDINDKKSTLTIKNESSKSIGNVLWNNINFKEDSTFIGSWNGDRTGTVTRTVNLDIFENNTYSVSFSAIGGQPDYFTDESFSGSWVLEDNNTSTLFKGGKLLILSENRASLKWSAYSKKYTIRWWEYDYELSKSNTEDIKYGTSITKTVDPGSGYIYFSVGTAAYRTRDIVNIEKENTVNFVFTNYTLVVKVTEPDSIKTLGKI